MNERYANPTQSSRPVAGRAFEGNRGMWNITPGDGVQSAKSKESMNLKEILVPMDFTTCSFRALEKAIDLAGQLNSGIVLLHVIDLPKISPGPASEYDRLILQLRGEAIQKLGELTSRLASSGIVFETVVRDGILHEVILDFARERHIDIIVLGKNKRKPWQIFHRHTAECIQKHAPGLVQVVCEEEPLPGNRISNFDSPTILF